MLPPPGYQTTLPLNRFLTDEQIAALARPHGAASRGVIGMALLNNFLDPRWGFSPRGRETQVTMAEQGAAQLRHLAEIAGWESIGIGSDTDIAVYGREETPPSSTASSIGAGSAISYPRRRETGSWVATGCASLARPSPRARD